MLNNPKRLFVTCFLCAFITLPSASGVIEKKQLDNIKEWIEQIEIDANKVQKIVNSLEKNENNIKKCIFDANFLTPLQDRQKKLVDININIDKLTPEDICHWLISADKTYFNGGYNKLGCFTNIKKTVENSSMQAKDNQEPYDFLKYLYALLRSALENCSGDNNGLIDVLEEVYHHLCAQDSNPSSCLEQRGIIILRIMKSLLKQGYSELKEEGNKIELKKRSINFADNSPLNPMLFLNTKKKTNQDDGASNASNGSFYLPRIKECINTNPSDDQKIFGKEEEFKEDNNLGKTVELKFKNNLLNVKTSTKKDDLAYTFKKKKPLDKTEEEELNGAIQRSLRDLQGHPKNALNNNNILNNNSIEKNEMIEKKDIHQFTLSEIAEKPIDPDFEEMILGMTPQERINNGLGDLNEKLNQIKKMSQEKANQAGLLNIWKKLRPIKIYKLLIGN